MMHVAGAAGARSSTISGKAVDEVAARAPAEVDPLAAFPGVGAECVMLDFSCSQSAVGGWALWSAGSAGCWGLGDNPRCLKFVI
jgi:hypothetical protein